MKKVEDTTTYWKICEACKGRGTKTRKLRKKVKLRYQAALAAFEKTKDESIKPLRPKGTQYPCSNCGGSGLVAATSAPIPDTENFPQVAIIGAGIGGVALAVACLHRGIPFTLYERDSGFDIRSQGYGLTLQQASKAMEGFGLFSLAEGVISTRHVVHTTQGKILGEWGMRKWLQKDAEPFSKRTNVHIARQSLRMALLKQLGGNEAVHWGHELLDFKENEAKKFDVRFEVNGNIKHAKADIVVGADGIRSKVRGLLIGDAISPLRYLNCIVILGICKLSALEGVESDLLDSDTVFQTANGTERMYMMPYAADSVMWQLSFPLPEKEAKALSARGSKALKEEAGRRTPWHDPIPQIVAATEEMQISGYPVYDRELLTPEIFKNFGNATLLGDAAHPMSPFKGQGANQALLDALALARNIYRICGQFSNWKEVVLREHVLQDFEMEMLKRSASKVKDSAAAAQFLHSDVVLQKRDAPRGRGFKKSDLL